ncbi:MAG: hypothetical protein FDX30_10640 [Chlorobium sp.]|nr:MAG: hypothetical protein FDX30_10640 [Chlorobium sp.]
MKKYLLYFLILLSPFFIEGCTATKNIVTDAVDINKSLEDTENKLLLLNIIRASKHRFKYYTDFTRFSGSTPSLESKLSLTFPLEENNYVPAALHPEISSKQSISYDIGMMQSKDFLRGYLNPATLETVRSYWDMGWSKSMLFNLFVSQIRYFSWKRESEKNGTYHLVLDKTITNDPLKGREWHERFNNEVNLLIADGMDILYRKSLPETAAKEVAHENGKNGHSSSLPDGSCIVRLNESTGKTLSYTFSNKYTLCIQTDIPFLPISENGNKAYPYNGSQNRKFAVLYLRSPSSIMNYLGDLVRVQLTGDSTPQHEKYCPEVYLETEKKKVPLMVVREGDGVSKYDPKFSVSYEGRTYIIPKDDYDRTSFIADAPGAEKLYLEGETPKTMEILFLINQLITQFKSNSEFQSVPAVRTIN